ncbi:hypothetical protein [Burkholderia stagnalis]|uniref:hypothetical protein n=1 Tax=Burkholderia stagnalis TaxID=1503054 RepID=UPI000B236A99
MTKAREIFEQKPAATSVEWDAAMLANPEKSWLNSEQSTLADVFSKFFEKFVDACESAESFFEAFNIYQPVRVVISDLAGFARDQNKPLSDYDALQGEPFWLQ